MSIRSVGKTPSARISRALALWIATALSTMAQTLDHFDFSAINSPKYVYAPFRILVTAKSSTGAIVRTYTGTPVLTAISGGTTVSVEALSDLIFTSGQWVGNVVVTEPASDVMLRVTGSGRSGTSAAFHARASRKGIRLRAVGRKSRMPRVSDASRHADGAINRPRASSSSGTSGRVNRKVPSSAVRNS